jgi:hypothetical protein
LNGIGFTFFPLLVPRRGNCVIVYLIIFVMTFLGRAANSQSLRDYERDFLNRTWTLETLWEPAVSAGGSVAWSDFVAPINGYGPGWQGYGHHYVVALGDNVNGKFMRNFVFAAASQTEDNYSPKSDKFWSRVGYAALHTFVVDPEGSTKRFNWSGVPASFAAAALSNAYQPAPQRTWSATFERAGTGTAGYAGGNVWTVVEGVLKDVHPRWHAFLTNR